MTQSQNFGWTRFYEEFAYRLLDHKDDRTKLVAVVREVCSRVGYSNYENIKNSDGTTGLRDICPFTTMGAFNRGHGIKGEKRQAVALQLGHYLGVTEPAPDSFEGIPTLLHMTAVVFWDINEVDLLWHVFENAIRLADHGERAWQPFVESYDRAIQTAGVGINLTMGLFWARPRSFLPLDSNSRHYIGTGLGVTLPNQMPPPGRQYLELADFLKYRFDDAAFPVHSFQELSLAAYESPSPESGAERQPVTPPVETEQSGAETNEETGTPTDTYTLDNILAEGCFLEKSKLENTLNRLKNKQNLILQGPPGTGKTWLAKRLAYALIGERNDKRISRLQFHPTLSYEDFIRGYRPDGEGKLVLVDGPFLEVIEAAKRDEANVYVMVIEEINRGNPAQIFGEMLTLLEADKRGPGEALRLAHSKVVGEQAYVPPNVYVIGTMNVADRSIALVDLALRRRFAFVDLEPIFGIVWQDWVHDEFDVPREFLTAIRERISALNERIAADTSLGPQFRVGHSYVTPAPGTLIDDPAEWFTQVVETEIGPLLDEYWFDNASEAEKAKKELLSGL